MSLPTPSVRSEPERRRPRRGTYKAVSRFVRFNNVVELSRLLQEAWDIRVAREVPQMREQQPAVRRHTVQAPNYPALESFQKTLEDRVNSLGSR